MKIAIGAGLIVLLAITTAVLVAADTAKGKEVFVGRCATCHGQGGEGKEAIAKMFKVTMKSLAAREIQDKKDNVLKNVVLKGSGKMRPVAVSDLEATNVVAYLRTLVRK